MLMITPPKVHFIIQQMSSKLPGFDDVIPVNAIAENLHMNTDELSVYLDTLQALRYLKFTDRTNGEISLTETGRHTIVPM